MDAYRNKMRSTMLTAGQEVEAVAPHFETRVGKRKWLERERRVAAGRAAGRTGSGSARRGVPGRRKAAGAGSGDGEAEVE